MLDLACTPARTKVLIPKVRVALVVAPRVVQALVVAGIPFALVLLMWDALDQEEHVAGTVAGGHAGYVQDVDVHSGKTPGQLDLGVPQDRRYRLREAFCSLKGDCGDRACPDTLVLVAFMERRTMNLHPFSQLESWP